MRVLGVVAFSFVLAFSCIEGKWVSDWIRMTIDSPAVVADKVNIVFTPDNNNVVIFPMKNLPFLLDHPKFNFSRPTVMYVHGWMASGVVDTAVLGVRGAYNDRGDHNVLTVDWSVYSKNINYNTAVIPQLKVIAETLAELLRDFLNNGYDVADLHLVGHSLGGQMVGKIGRTLKALSSGKLVIPRIYALDPAAPGFETSSIDGFDAVGKLDADYVQVIHTCIGKLGMQHRVGSADFFPNGGIRHPGCDEDPTSTSIKPSVITCDHGRAHQFYQASVRDPHSYPAIRCNSWDDFINNGTCFKDDINYMGFGAKLNATGKYFLETRANIFNMSKGRDGLKPMKINITSLPNPMERSFESVYTLGEEDVFF